MDEPDFKRMERVLHSNILCRIARTIPDAIIFIAVSLGLYTRWISLASTSILFVAIIGLFLLTSNAALRYYFSIHW